MHVSVRLPWQHRRSRWERVRDAVAERREHLHLRQSLAEAGRLHNLPEASRLREHLPDPADLARRAQPLVDRVAAAGHDLHVSEAPALLHEGLDRLNRRMGRRQPPLGERVLGSNVPIWLAIGIGIGAFVAGLAIGHAAAAGARRARVDPSDLEAAAGKIKDRWPAVHDDDIREAKGNLKQLSSVVAERTGENARDVRERLSSLTGAQSANGGSSQQG